MTAGYTAAVIARACVAREFAAFATNKQRPVSKFLRALARDLKASTPGKGVGVIGQCFTGGFALAAAVDDSVLDPVLSQPSVPLPLGRARRRDTGLSEPEMATIADRCANDGLCAMGLRFSEDKIVPRERFAALKERLGDSFEIIEIDSGPGNEGGFATAAHSVLTDEVREDSTAGSGLDLAIINPLRRDITVSQWADEPADWPPQARPRRPNTAPLAPTAGSVVCSELAIPAQMPLAK